MMHHKLAIRNILRNKRRMTLTLLAIVSGCVALVLFGGFIDYSFWGLRETFIHSRLGHLQVFRRGLPEARATGRLTLDRVTFEKLAAILAAEEQVVLFTPRVKVAGLVSNGEITAAFSGDGISPEQESELGWSFFEVLQGELLEPGDREAIVLAGGLAEALDARPGQLLTLVTATAEGAFNALDAPLKGIFTTGQTDYDQHALLLPLALARALTYSSDVERVVVLLDRTESVPAVRSRLEEKIRRAGLELDLVSWSELAGFYHKVVRMYSGTFRFIKAIIALIVILSISNTMSMAVLERTREIGTMAALGAGSRTVLQVFLLEGLYLGLIGGALGLGTAFVAAQLINLSGGIAIAPPPGSSRGYVVLINMVPGVMVYALVTAVLSALLSALLPALRASRMPTAEALRAV